MNKTPFSNCMNCARLNYSGRCDAGCVRVGDSMGEPSRLGPLDGGDATFIGDHPRRQPYFSIFESHNGICGFMILSRPYRSHSHYGISPPSSSADRATCSIPSEVDWLSFGHLRSLNPWNTGKLRNLGSKRSLARLWSVRSAGSTFDW